MAATSRIHASIDFDAGGSNTGYLRVPHSSHESAYGWLGLPAACINGGAGPTLLLLGGVHGDEYEGQLALARLIRALSAVSIRGRIIVLTSTNMPAVLAGNRLSPVDQGNLNRAFPGDANGTPTQLIAHYIEEVLLPMSDYVIDLHSGGSSLDYLPCVRARQSRDERIARETKALMAAFDAHWGVLLPPTTETRTLSAACERKGVVYINPETGGGARIGREALAIAYDGVLKCLAHLGMIGEDAAPASAGRTRFATLRAGGGSLVYGECEGLWEPLVDLQDRVAPGQAVALVHDPRRPWREPEPVAAPDGGVVLCRRASAWTSLGDCLYEIGVPLDE